MELSIKNLIQLTSSKAEIFWNMYKQNAFGKNFHQIFS